MYEPVKEGKKEFYLKIWMHYAVGHFSQEQLANLFNCSQDTIYNAVKWSANTRVQFDVPVFAEAAKEAVEARLRELKNDLVRVKESERVNWNYVIGLNRLIKESEESLWRFQGLIQDKNFIIQNYTIGSIQQSVSFVNKMTPEDKEKFLEIVDRYAEPPEC